MYPGEQPRAIRSCTTLHSGAFTYRPFERQMTSIQAKVKDIVEVRAHKNLRDFSADPAETVGGYYFTDGTSELMAKWLDHVASVGPEHGAAFALAGYRGV